MQNEIEGSFIALKTGKTGAKRRKGNVLIVSPHPDDDVIGAGGTMYLLAKKGFSIFSLYVTHGSSPVAKQSVIDARQREALAALKTVNASAGIFLNCSSREIEKSFKDILKVLLFLKPVAVYLPSPFERHPTHRAVTRLTIKSLKKTDFLLPELWGYSVWGSISGLPGTRVVDISGAASAKRSAIRKHRSQILFKGYDEAALARNRYEGICCETHRKRVFRFAETFLDMRELIGSNPTALRSFIRKMVEEFLQ